MTIDCNARRNKKLGVQAELAETANADDKGIVQCYVEAITIPMHVQMEMF